MIKQSLLLSFIALIGYTSSAQLRYSFKDTFTAYTPLAGASSLNGSTIWDDETFTMPLPFPWRIDRDMKVGTLNLILGLPGITVNNNISDISGFLLGDMDIADRGNPDTSSSKSPIRYVTTGTAPRRIFKLEFFNAGFADEFNLYHTMSDSFNMQVWIYEGSNIVEYHFGKSRITYPGNYYYFRGFGPFMGYLKHVDFKSGNSGSVYYVTDYRDLDTFTAGGFAPNNQLSDWPFNGEVFRFTPTWTSCDKPAALFSTDTIIDLAAQFTYTGSVTNLDSLIWSFGDGTYMHVTQNLVQPISHVYASAGHFNVGVIAYSDCGNDTAVSRENSLGVRNIGGMHGARVYPNPATDVLHIEGMQQGAATVVSSIGQVVLRQAIESTRTEVLLDRLATGSYTLLLSDQQGLVGTMRFVKQ